MEIAYGVTNGMGLSLLLGVGDRRWNSFEKLGDPAFSDFGSKVLEPRPIAWATASTSSGNFESGLFKSFPERGAEKLSFAVLISLVLGTVLQFCKG
ncbi:hypothetical protein H6F90_12480 [Trichocoleus sp. FACHB-591]|uniref:hypothetical protein n=1 Tax=Trichocoleus sp. FACHB-591 TaxID=2692872 RepID=UPI001686350D|nr:hypothetical protein [Trichocoleus sp. FACHB-591]MBD2095963.1 hypothetical protein [Trichocoleus sp. FACHB-591]